MDINAAIDRTIIAHQPGWCPRRQLDLTAAELDEAVTLDYQKVDLTEPAGLDCWSVTPGWRISLLDDTDTILITHAEPYGTTYPDGDTVRDACRNLITSWRHHLARRAARREAAETFAATIAHLGQDWRLTRVVNEILEKRLTITEAAAACGLTTRAIEAEIDRRDFERRSAEYEAEVQATYDHLNKNRIKYVTAEELANWRDSRYTTPDSVRRALSRAKVPAIGYDGRYRKARYDRQKAEAVVSRHNEEQS